MIDFYFYLCIFFMLLSAVCAFYAIKFGILVLRFQDALEDSLDVIDEKYNSITSICERPLFYDSPEVRQVLKDIKDTRDSLHGIAFSLSSSFQVEDKIVEDEDGA